MCLKFVFESTRFPVPKYEIAFTIAAAHPLAIGRKPNLASVASNGMSCETFLAVLAEIIRTVYQYLIIQRLGSEIFV